ncbi:MAG: carboxypeptidase-like regulatory domain-containing protein [Bacteroidales bacterium]|nr:carboxypeptidase-like regulatory domain-containing protein [Bacteroidales bacterium]
MPSFCGYIIVRIQVIAFFLLIIIPEDAICQRGILDSTFTFRAGTVKTGNALNIITRQTGFNFTYDSRLIDPEKKTVLTFINKKLGLVLDSILKNDTLVYSVIDKYIIISRQEKKTDSVDTKKPQSTVNKITGVIIDDETSEPLPFATIGLKNKGKGTVTNFNGEFGLNITADYYSDTLSVSYLGYIKREIPVKNALGSDISISMKREFISIPEIIIRNQIPQDILSKTRHAIAENYGTTPALMTAFYREGVLKKSEVQTYSEAVLQIYKSAYSGSLLGDQIKVFRSRKIENINRSDTLAIRLKAGLSTCLDLDGARNMFDFITLASMADYTYRMTDIVTYDEEAAYVIEFQQRESVDLPLFKGTIYINTVDYAILYAEFEINPLLIHKMKDTFISASSRGFNTWPVSVKYAVSYRKVNERYFLSHVRGDLIFASKQKKKLFSTQFKVFFELAVTETSLNNVIRFERDELAPVHSIFSKTINSYDPLFWGNQDFLRPEDNLLQSLKNMNVKLQEFTK